MMLMSSTASNYFDDASSGCSSAWLSVAKPMLFRPLSTYTRLPVMAEARGDNRKAAALPTSLADSSFWMGAFS